MRQLLGWRPEQLECGAEFYAVDAGGYKRSGSQQHYGRARDAITDACYDTLSAGGGLVVCP